MRTRFLFFTLAVVVLLIAGLCSIGAQQVNPISGVTYDWAAVSGTGQLGGYLYQYQNGITSGSSNFTIDWGVTGTAPSACTFRVEGSSDAVAWTGLDATAPLADSAPCTSSNLLSIAYKPARFIRINIVTYTAGDSTTKVIFHYTRGSM